MKQPTGNDISLESALTGIFIVLFCNSEAGDRSRPGASCSPGETQVWLMFYLPVIMAALGSIGTLVRQAGFIKGRNFTRCAGHLLCPWLGDGVWGAF